MAIIGNIPYFQTNPLVKSDEADPPVHGWEIPEAMETFHGKFFSAEKSGSVHCHV